MLVDSQQLFGGGRVQVIVRSLSILRTLAHSAGGLSLAELSDRIGIL